MICFMLRIFFNKQYMFVLNVGVLRYYLTYSCVAWVFFVVFFPFSVFPFSFADDVLIG